MNLLSAISLIAFLAYLEVGLYVLFKNPGSKLNRSFFYLCLCFVIWSLPFVFFYGTQLIERAYFWYQISAVGWCLSAPVLLRFKFYLTGYPKSEKLKNLLSLLLIIPSFFFFYLVVASKWAPIEFLEHNRYWHFISDNDFSHIGLFLLYIYIYSGLAIFLLYKWRKRTRDNDEKRVFNNVVFITLLFTLSWISIFDMLLPVLYNVSLPLTGHVISLVYVGGLAYVMLKNSLFAVTPKMVADKVIEELNQVVIFTDTDTNILRINKYTKSLLGFETTELLGVPLTNLVLEKKKLGMHITMALKKGHSELLEFNFHSSGGQLIFAKISILAINDSFGDLLGFFVYGHDSRETKKLEAELRNRELAEKRLRNTGEMLERLIRERKEELESSYKDLQVKIAERMRVEEQIKSDISEKEVLINEIHNRVIDNMNMIISLVNTQMSENLSLKSYRKFQELNQRICCMLWVHNNLYLSINYSDVDFAGFLNTLVAKLFEDEKQEINIDVKRNISDIFLNFDYAIPLGLIANELLTNVMLHAFPRSFLLKQKSFKPKIFVSYSYDGEYYNFVVSDNGKGLPGKFNIDKLNTSGMQLVDFLVKDQLNGEWKITSDEGVYARISFRPGN